MVQLGRANTYDNFQVEFAGIHTCNYRPLAELYDTSSQTYDDSNNLRTTVKNSRYIWPTSTILRLYKDLKNSKFGWPVIIRQVNAIRLIRLEAPHSVHVGQPIRLRCLYETTRGDKLQSLSWYRNGREFYRYQPFERLQPILAFNLSGVNVDVSSQSTRCN